jgi:proteic killer suppression protein
VERFADDASRLIWEGKPNKASRRLVPSRLHAKAARIDVILNTDSLKDCFMFPPGWDFKSLRGKLQGIYQVRIDQKYRIRFGWEKQHGAIDITAGEFHDEDD